jgi:(2Fe-2S) ferredoxin
VHGRNCKPPAENLQDLVAAALRAGIERDYPDHLYRYDEVDLQLAYYGDLNNDVLRRRGRQYDAQIDSGDRSNALQNLRSLDTRKRFSIRQYDCLPGKTAVPEFIASVFAPLCGALGLTRLLAGRVAPDFAEYIAGESGYAEAVRDRLRNALCAMLDRGDRVMLVSHGTGCVVAYDVLWQLSHEARFAAQYADAKIDTWLTLGAPLGDRGIRKFLLGHKGEPVTFPQNVITWHNVAAEDAERFLESHHPNGRFVENNGGSIGAMFPRKCTSLCKLNTQRLNHVIVHPHVFKKNNLFRIFSFPL